MPSPTRPSSTPCTSPNSADSACDPDQPLNPVGRGRPPIRDTPSLRIPSTSGLRRARTSMTRHTGRSPRRADTKRRRLDQRGTPRQSSDSHRVKALLGTMATDQLPGERPAARSRDRFHSRAQRWAYESFGDIWIAPLDSGHRRGQEPLGWRRGPLLTRQSKQKRRPHTRLDDYPEALVRPRRGRSRS
jgi:hypothetical protein